MRKITSVGIALILAMVVITTILVLGNFRSPPARAFHDPFSSGTAVTNVTVTADPNTPGVSVTYTISFQTPSTLNSAVDKIKIEFEDDVGVPLVIAPSDVFIVDNDALTGGNPLSVTVQLVGSDGKNEPLVTLGVPDMNADLAGLQGIAAGSDVTVIFR